MSGVKLSAEYYRHDIRSNWISACKILQTSINKYPVTIYIYYIIFARKLPYMNTEHHYDILYITLNLIFFWPDTLSILVNICFPYLIDIYLL